MKLLQKLKALFNKKEEKAVEPLKAGDIVKFKDSATWFTGKEIHKGYFNSKWKVVSVNDTRVVVKGVEGCREKVQRAIHSDFLVKVDEVK